MSLAKVIRIGEDFTSFVEFNAALDIYEKTKFVNYVIQMSRRDKNDDNIKYLKVRYECKLYGQHVKSSYQRETSTYKQGCCSYISISQKLQNNMPVLRVVAIKEEHNHPRKNSRHIATNLKVMSIITVRLINFITTVTSLLKKCAAYQAHVCEELIV